MTHATTPWIECSRSSFASRLGILGLIAIAASAGAGAGAATLTYPGLLPCNTTLQACADGAISGDIIEIATNTANTESVSITNKSLTFQPAVGFTPTLTSLFFFASSTNVTATVNGLSFTASVRGRLGAGGGNLTINITNNTINAGDSTAAIEVDDGTAAGTYGTKLATITGNTIIRGASFSSCANGISVLGTSAGFDATIVGNTISLTDLDQCEGINASVQAGVNATALIDRNRITGSNFNGGILVRNAGNNVGQPGGLITAQISNNLVSGQNGNVGSPGGVVVSASGNNSAANVVIVNNTVANGSDGIRVNARTNNGASIVGGAFNNIVAFNSRSGIDIGSALLSFTNSNNLIFANANNFFTAGAGTRTGDPSFVNAAGGNYRLLPQSDAIDRGLGSALPAAFTLDLPGDARRQGNSIDIGAYESVIARGADVAPTVPALNPLALLALLCALAARGAFALGRQQTR